MMPLLRWLWIQARNLNSHHVCYAGVGLAFASLVALGARDLWDPLWAAAHLDGFAPVAHALVDGAATVGLVVVWPAIIAAALGRPPTIPGGPK